MCLRMRVPTRPGQWHRGFQLARRHDRLLSPKRRWGRAQNDSTERRLGRLGTRTERRHLCAEGVRGRRLRVCGLPVDAAQ